MTSKPFTIPQCKLHKKDMSVVSENEAIFTFICGVEDCNEMIDILKIFIDREDPKLKSLWSWADLL